MSFIFNNIFFDFLSPGVGMGIHGISGYLKHLRNRRETFYSWCQWLVLIQPLGWQSSHWTMFIKHNGNFAPFLAMRHKKTYRYLCHQPRKFSWWQIVRMLYWRNDIVNDCKWCVTIKPSMQTCSEFNLYILISIYGVMISINMQLFALDYILQILHIGDIYRISYIHIHNLHYVTILDIRVSSTYHLHSRRRPRIY